MVQFSKKAKQANTGGSTGNVDQDAWNAWNEYLFELMKGKEVDRGNGRFRKSKNCIAVVNMIMDFGTPPCADSEWDVKPEHVMPIEGEDYSQYELDYMEEHAGSDFITTKDWDANAINSKGKKGMMVEVRKQTSKRNPVQEYGLCIDVPSILVDWSKHPLAAEGAGEDLRPYRISLNGFMFGNRKKIGRALQFETDFRSGEVSEKNYIRKIAIAAGIDAELVESEFDIGELAGAVCNFQVTFDISRGDRVFLNDSASKPVAIEDIEYPDPQNDGEMAVFSSEAQIKKALAVEGLQEFTGILLNDMEYDDEMFSMIYGDKFNFVARAKESDTFIVTRKSDGEEFELGTSYDTSDFKKAFDEYCEKRDGDKKKTDNKAKADKKKAVKEEVKDTPAKKETPKPKTTKKPEPEELPEDDMDDGEDFDDDIPF